MSFSKYIVWGCDLHQHNNSNVYAAFFKAFKAMGFDAYWLNDKSDVSGMDFSNSLFITEWQHAGGIPKRKDCKYILHNCNASNFDGIGDLNVLHLQTYTDPCRDGTCVHKHVGKPIKLNDHGTWYLDDPREPTLFQPWATDLLPDEINFADADAPRRKEVNWIGTIGDGLYGNINEIHPFRRALEENGIEWNFRGPGSTSFEQNRELVKSSFMAPAIHGTEQCRVGYIACRVFKNISYGHLGATNCKAAADLFEGKLVYNPNTYELFFDILKRLNDKAAIIECMKIVKEKHTYIDRINTILEVA